MEKKSSPEFIKVKGHVYRKVAEPKTAQRNVRNFWVELKVDGKTVAATGPRSSTGGFSATIKMRDKGGIVEALTLMGTADPDGNIQLKAVDQNGQELVVNTTR